MREGQRSCGRCGHELRQATRFCTKCGHPVPQSAAQAAAPESGPAPDILVRIGPGPPAFAPTVTSVPEWPPPLPVQPGAEPPWPGPPAAEPPWRGPPAGKPRRSAFPRLLAVALAVLIVAAGGTAAAVFLTRHSGAPAQRGPAERARPSRTQRSRQPRPSQPGPADRGSDYGEPGCAAHAGKHAGDDDRDRGGEHRPGCERGRRHHGCLLRRDRCPELQAGMGHLYGHVPGGQRPVPDLGR